MGKRGLNPAVLKQVSSGSLLGELCVSVCGEEMVAGGIGRRLKLWRGREVVKNDFWGGGGVINQEMREGLKRMMG